MVKADTEERESINIIATYTPEDWLAQYYDGSWSSWNSWDGSEAGASDNEKEPEEEEGGRDGALSFCNFQLNNLNTDDGKYVTPVRQPRRSHGRSERATT